jgi:hypothetical protein
MYIRKNKQKQAAILFYFLIKRNRSGKYKKGGIRFFLFSQEKSSQKSASNEGEGIRMKNPARSKNENGKNLQSCNFSPKSLNQKFNA